MYHRSEKIVFLWVFLHGRIFQILQLKSNIISNIKRGPINHLLWKDYRYGLIYGIQTTRGYTERHH